MRRPSVDLRSAPRAGFTLLELALALAIAGLLSTLVYGGLAAAADTRGRLERVSATRDRDVAGRVILQDALRNALPALRPGDPPFRLDPDDGLRFLTRGTMPPLLPELDWVVTVAPGAGGWVELRAEPVGLAATPPVVIPLAGRALRVEALDGNGAWVERWSLRTVLPRAVRFRLAAEPPVVVALPRGVAR